MNNSDLQTIFVEYGVFVLAKAITDGTEVDPKIYETINRYLEKKEIEDIPEPEAGSLASKKLEELRKKHGHADPA